jgi:TRAP-type C4-dicarboxylate transport system substrate-binding protein
MISRAFFRPATIALAIAMLLMITTTVAEESEFRVLTGFPENSKPQRILARSAKRISRETKRSVELRYVTGDATSSAELLSEFLHDPALDAALLPGSSLQQLMPNAALYGQAFLFRDESEVEFLRDKVDPELIATLQTDEIIAVGLSGLGFLYLMGPEFGNGVEELAGQTVWMPFESSHMASVLAALSVHTITADPNQIDAVPTDLPDYIIHNPTALILNKKIPRPDLMLELPLQYGYFILVVKRANWDDLKSADRTLLQIHFDEQLRNIEKKALSAAVRSRRLLIRRGMTTVGLDSQDLAGLGAVGENQEIDPSLQALLQSVLEGYRKTLDSPR